MLKYQFECTDEKITRSKFENLMACDKPCGKDILGNNLYGGGIHFTECSKRVKGFFINPFEDESIRGGPPRIYFNGAFIEKNGKTIFEVFIYPSIFQLLLFILAFVFFLITSTKVGLIIFAVVFSFFTVGYYFDIKKTADELGIMVI